ncbi:hypothetical protein OHA72_56730 [Dactylosporangium sp. NBC_01737]|uniref:phosphorylase family protein n=1 Tax=Dactylosporangium sp. NBC_01737 TaxID=2975959 RepID=UPI002E14F0D7|nr:hypothetical protein OHA72_56730 [Dactylosporangium sp. NBC_01737]
MGDGRIWQQLAAQGVRNITAVEMEAATIATIAHRRAIPWLVVKGVMDHAGMGKDDRYKTLAARCAAEVLYALLEQARPAPQVADNHAPSTGPSAAVRPNVLRSVPAAVTAAVVLAAAAAIPVTLDQFRDRGAQGSEVYYPFDLSLTGGFAYDIDVDPDESPLKNFGTAENEPADLDRDLYRSGLDTELVNWMMYVPEMTRRRVKSEMLATLPSTETMSQCRGLTVFPTAAIEGRHAEVGTSSASEPEKAGGRCLR